ncbi:hypothetical protein PV326_011318 [Microctonus aethiopoides]|nr:hypothetical protein PV326_011318 [Microctonus aethiopoides]
MSNGTVEKLMPSIGHSQKFILKRKELLSDINRNEVTNVRQPGQELRELLEETPLNFISSKQSLDPARKNEVARIIIQHIFKTIKPSLKISKERFRYWRTEIKSVWNKENVDFWYSPYIHRVQKVSGKLYHTYKNLKTKISKAHALQKDDNKKDPKSIELENLMIYTFNLREQSKLSPTELFKSYHLLEPPTAIKQKPKSLQLIVQYKDNFNATNASTIAWCVLPLLFLPTSKTTSLKKKSIKLSYQEQSDGFIRWIGGSTINITEIESTIANYNSRMLKYGLNT